MRASILICATCLVVSGCSAQLRFPSLSSALSSLTGFGSGSQGSAGQSSSAASPYSGLVRDYGRNLMMAMSSIYPSIFKPPQAQQAGAPQQQQQQQPQSAFEQFAASQPLQSLFSAAAGGAPAQPGAGPSGPSFSFGGSTFSISPSLPFGSLAGAPTAHQAPQQAGAQQAAHSPFSASFGSSINSPASFGPLSSAPLFQSQSMPSFAPASSYGAAFEAANSNSPGPFSANFQAPGAGQAGAYQPLSSSFGAQPFDSSAGSLLSPSVQQAPSSFGAGAHSGAFMGGIGAPPPGQQAPPAGQLSQQAPQAAASAPQPTQASPQQFGHHHSTQAYRPDMMSIAASAPVPSSNSYSNYGNIASAPSQQAPASASYQQPSYR